MEKYNEKTEKLLIELVKQKEEADKRLLSLEVVIGIISSLFLFSMVFVASFVEMQDLIRIALIVFGFLVFIVGVAYAIRIEQVAGYYECKKCGHKYIPTYNSVLWSMHMGRTRYMKCPHCGEKSWQKKVIGK